MKEAKRHASAPPAAPNLRTVLEQHGDFVCRSLRLLGVLEADLDDVLQEVFLVVNQRLVDYEERGRARAWLYSICTRLALAHRHKIGRRRENIAAELPDAWMAAPQLEQIVDGESLALGYELLQSLPREQRDVFWLYEVEDVPMAEIAQMLSCPLQTGYSRLHKARARILAAVQGNPLTRDVDHA